MKKRSVPSATNRRKSLENCFRAAGWKIADRETQSSHLRTWMRLEDNQINLYEKQAELREAVMTKLKEANITAITGDIQNCQNWLTGCEWTAEIVDGRHICISVLRRTPEGDLFRAGYYS